MSRLVNIANFKRRIYLFNRLEDGSLDIQTDNDFYPYFFEPSPTGEFKGYDGMPLKKVVVSSPEDITAQKSSKSYSSDIKYVNTYLINKVNKIEPTNPKILFLDIEVCTKDDFPNPLTAKFPVSCVTIYNNYTKDYVTWWLPDYEDEPTMLKDICFYIHGEAPDLILAWNISFDYVYLANRIEDFSKSISPIGLSRYGEEQGVLYPAGISIVDYLTLFKKVFMREASYALDHIAQKKLGEAKWPKTSFSDMTELVKQKNINDVKRMVLLEEKYKLIPYYDEIRRLTKVKWEDLYHNSRIVEMLLFEEAKKKNVILPTKPKDVNVTEFSGAIRESLLTGALFNIGKVDLTSAYPSMIVNFCLDTQNIDPIKAEDNIEVHGTYFRQNDDALLPSVVKRILALKDDLKIAKKKDKTLQTKYDAIKAIVNSTFGVMGNEYFRLYNSSVASAITFLVRDLLMYTRKRLEAEGYQVVYYDTDSVFLTTKEDISPKLNQYIQDWGKTYGKEKIELQYEYEGYFDKLFLLGKCHYYGYLHNSDVPEIKGIEAKRSNSSVYEAIFQKTLLDKMLNKESCDSILNWINGEKERIKTLPLEQIAFPCKVQNKEYKNVPIFVRALTVTKTLKADFKVPLGDIFYYIFIHPISSKDNVVAFTSEDNKFLDWNKQLDWSEIIRRNILGKAQNIFEAQGWDITRLSENNQLTF